MRVQARAADPFSWPPPDGRVDVISDLVAVITKFSNSPTAPIMSRTDLEPRSIDWKINISDAIRALNGFAGFPYQFTPSVGDPCP